MGGEMDVDSPNHKQVLISSGHWSIISAYLPKLEI